MVCSETKVQICSFVPNQGQSRNGRARVSEENVLAQPSEMRICSHGWSVDRVARAACHAADRQAI